MARAIPSTAAEDAKGTLVEKVFISQGQVLVSCPVTKLAFIDDVSFWDIDPGNWSYSWDGLGATLWPTREINWCGVRKQ
jgi:hypothetical protein